jgi:hypothetical protein
MPVYGAGIARSVLFPPEKVKSYLLKMAGD